MVTTIETPVLIVGAGPVGLALALDLNHKGTESLVVEQDAGTAQVMLAKAGTLNERTMEFCRRWGLVEEVAKHFPADYPRDNVYCTSLTGHLIGRSPVPSTNERDVPTAGPEMMRRCAQHLFDPILADAVKASEHASIRYGTRFEGFVQDDEGVISTLTELDTGKIITVRSQYLVGCDGAGSQVRKKLAVPFDLITQMDFSLSAMLKISHLEKYHGFGKCERFMFIDSNGTWANMTTNDGVDYWRFTVVGSEEALNPETFDIHPLVRRAFGDADVPYEVVRMVPWRRAQTLARTYRVGRVLLAGDSTHTTSPTGGHGLNTSIGDATGAAWILDAMVKGWGGEQLLESYTVERRPVATRNFSSSTQNYRAWVGGGMANVDKDTPEGAAARRNVGNHLKSSLHQEWFSQGIGMGYSYGDSPIIVPDGTPMPVDHPSFYLQTARPGHRAPHAWLTDGRSTLDLFGRGFVLLRFGGKTPDVSPLLNAACKRGMPLTLVDIDQPEIAVLYERRLVLVRPDGMVAWRSDCLPGDFIALVDHVRGETV